jgi:hypothetical protein
MEYMTINSGLKIGRFPIYTVTCNELQGHFLPHDILYCESQPELSIEVLNAVILRQMKTADPSPIEFSIKKPDFDIKTIPPNSRWIKKEKH